MHSNYQWVENKYQPGLFTFYLQEQSLCPPKVKQDTNLSRNNFNKRRFQSQIKISPKTPSSQRYCNPKQTLTPRIPKRIFNISKATNSFKRINIKQKDSENLQTINLLKIESLSGNNPILKRVNISSQFQQKLNKIRAKMFICRRQPSSYIRKPNKNCIGSPESMSKSQYPADHNKWRVNTQEPTNIKKQSIDSDGEDAIAKATQRLSFLDFMLQRNRQERALKNISQKKKIEKALIRLNNVERPKMLQVPTMLIDQN